MNHCVLGVNGERMDPISGTTHLGNGYRAYNAVLMRLNCPDSMSPFEAGGINPYAYCVGDPVNNVDPSGHFSLGQWVGMGVGLLAGIALSIVTEGSAMSAVVTLMTTVAGDALIGVGAELVTQAVDKQRVGWGPVGMAAGLSAAVTLAGYGLGMIRLKGTSNRPFGGLMLTIGEKNIWRSLRKQRPRISRPMELRIYNDNYPRFVANKKNLLDQEIYNAKLAIENRGGRTSTIHDLYELKQHVYFHDNYFHKFVLSEKNELSISSIPDRREFRLISHQALAFIENIEEPIKTAGIISANERGVFKITNQSGHYRSTPESLKHMEALLALWGTIPELREMAIVARPL